MTTPPGESPDDGLPAFRRYIMSLISFSVTVALGLVSELVLDLDAADTFLVVSIGGVVSLALGLIEQRLNSDKREFHASITSELANKLDLLRMIDRIDDPQLQNEVFLLSRRLSTGEVPSHIAAVRTPHLYETARSTVYASNVSLTREMLYRWDELARFRQIVEVSARRSRDGVSFARTFFLSRREIIRSDGRWDARSFRTLTAQLEANIDVRIVWTEDLEVDTLPPHRKLIRDLTIFDGKEAVDTTGVQVIYRHPSDRVSEFLDIMREQMKYSEPFSRYAHADMAQAEELLAQD